LNLLGISRKYLYRVGKSLNQVVEGLATLHDVLRFAKRFRNRGISVDAHVQISLQFFLRLFYQKKADLFWYGVAHISHHDRVVVVNSCSQFLHESFLSIYSGNGLLLQLIGVLGDRIAILVKLWRLLPNLHIVLLWLHDDARACFLKVDVVRKEIALFRIDNRLDKFLGVLP